MKQDITYSKSGLTVVGGGISGTALSRLLQQGGKESITLLDKSRRLGGRASYILGLDHDQGLAIGVHQCIIDMKQLSTFVANNEVSIQTLMGDLGWELTVNAQTDSDEQLYKLSPTAWSPTTNSAGP